MRPAGPTGAGISLPSGVAAQTANRSAPVAAEIARISSDMVAALLHDLSASDAAKLLDILARPPLPPESPSESQVISGERSQYVAARPQQLTQAAVSPARNAEPAPAIEPWALLPDLSTPDAVKLLDILAQPPLSEPLPLGSPIVFQALPGERLENVAARPDELLHAAIEAAAGGDATRAVEQLTEFAALAPLQVEGLRSLPALAPVRVEVERFVARLALIAKLEAGVRLEHAGQLVESAGSTNLPGWDAKPETVLQIANRLFDSGGHDNYVRAGQVAQAVIDVYEASPVSFHRPPLAGLRRVPKSRDEKIRFTWISWSAALRRAAPRIQELWRRAPLLVLLLSWFSFGLAAGLSLMLLRAFLPEAVLDFSSAAFKLWGIGLLALVGFGFYMRVRNVRL